ncbi:MAG: DNRLRE domain-containing protein, partial [Thermoproteota archaeon]
SEVGYSTSAKIRRAIVKFDLTSIPAIAWVDSANVSLYVASFSQSFTIGIHRVQQSPARAWTEGNVTWNKYDGTNSWTNAGGDFNGTATSTTTLSSSGYWNWTATYDVRNFVQTSSTNYGWILKSTTESSSYAVALSTKEATSNKPKIYVSYISSPYDIVGKTGVNGLQAGEDSDSLAIAMRLGDFAVSSMTSGDKYEINFTIGNEDFSMLFVATGASEGKLKLCYKEHGTSTWNDGDSATFSSMSSGTRYASSSGNIAVKLTDSTPGSYGWVKLEAKRTYLTELGAAGYTVSEIDAISYQGSSTSTLRPGAQGGTKMDRCPSGSGYATYSMTPIPEFPSGILFLILPMAPVNVYLRKRFRHAK